MKHIGCKKYNIQVLLQSFYINKDFLYLDLSFRNYSDISFDIDFIHFKIADKKVSRRTAMQENQIIPIRTYKDLNSIAGNGKERNIYVLPKVTLSNNKILVVDIYERNVERHQSFRISHKDLSKARPIVESKL